MKAWATVRSVLWRNSLLLQRLRTSTAYTWENLLLAVLFLACLGGAIARVGCWLNARMYLSVLPDDLAEYDRLLLLGTRQECIESGLQTGLGLENGPFFSPLEIIATLTILLSWVLVYFVSLGKSLRGLGYRDRWDRLDAEEIRALPVSPGQVIVARHDWSLLKYVTFLCAVPLLLLLPSREDAVLLLDPSNWESFPLIDIDHFLLVVAFTCATWTYAGFRGAQIMSRYRMSWVQLRFYLRGFLLFILLAMLIPCLLSWGLPGNQKQLAVVGGIIALLIVLVRRLRQDVKIRALRYDSWSLLGIALTGLHILVAIQIDRTWVEVPSPVWNCLLVTAALSNLAAWRAITIAPAILADPESFDAAPPAGRQHSPPTSRPASPAEAAPEPRAPARV